MFFLLSIYKKKFVIDFLLELELGLFIGENPIFTKEKSVALPSVVRGINVIFST
jgi:hypothetical protein